MKIFKLALAALASARATEFNTQRNKPLTKVSIDLTGNDHLSPTSKKSIISPISSNERMMALLYH